MALPRFSVTSDSTDEVTSDPWLSCGKSALRTEKH